MTLSVSRINVQHVAMLRLPTGRLVAAGSGMSPVAAGAVFVLCLGVLAACGPASATKPTPSTNASASPTVTPLASPSPSTAPSPNSTPTPSSRLVFTLILHGTANGDSFQLHLNIGGQTLRDFCNAAQPGGCPGGGKSYVISMYGAPKQGVLPYAVERYSTDNGALIEVIQNGSVDTNLDSAVTVNYTYP